jgi:hypothetical protein
MGLITKNRDYITGDWHLPGGNKSDTCVIEWVQSFINVYDTDIYSRDIIGIGDMHERFKNGWPALISTNLALYQRLNAILERKQGYFHLILGNHDYDGGHKGFVHTTLAEAGLTRITVDYPRLYVAGWQMEHGNRFDDWNRTPIGGGRTSPFYKIAHGLTWLTGKAERIPKIGGLIHEHRLNPQNWISPAAKYNDLEHPIHKAAQHEAMKEHKNIIIGHTHFAGTVFGHNWSYANPGGLTKGHEFSFLILHIESGIIQLVGHSDDN